MGPLNSLLCPGGGFLYTMIVQGGGFLPPSSRVAGGGKVLDEIDSCISGSKLFSKLDLAQNWNSTEFLS